MEINNVPQNKKNLHKGNYKTIVYAVDKDGKYVATQTSGWEPEDIAHSHAWDVIEKRIKETKELVLQGKFSPIAYFMEKNIMTPKRLSGMTGFSTRKVKKHLTPKGFSNLSKKQLTAYADIFEITLNELITPN